MRVDARAFRGVLEVLQAFSGSGQLVSGSNFCRVVLRGGRLRAALPTSAGWVSVEANAVEEAGDPEEWGVDLLLFRRTLRGVVWPKSGDAGEVVVAHSGAGVTVTVPTWSRSHGGQWVSLPPKEFRYPLSEQVVWDAGALPGTELSGEVLSQVTATGGVWDRVVSGVEKSAASGDDKPLLRNVQVVFRSDEVLALATDGGQAAFSSETVAQTLEEDLSFCLSAGVVSVVQKVLKAARASEDPLRLSVVQHPITQRRSLHLAVTTVPVELALVLPDGELPMATLEGLPASTSVPVGVVSDPARFVTDLGLAGWNPDARVVWFLWDDTELVMRSHSPMLTTSFRQPLEQAVAGIQLAVDQARISKAVQQLSDLADSDCLRLYVDNAARPRRLLVRCIRDGGERVSQVVLMTTVTKGYSDFRARSEELAERDARKRRAADRSPLETPLTPATVPA